MGLPRSSPGTKSLPIVQPRFCRWIQGC